ncbi:uncharacterized protein LOC123559656 isoform X2 [Mercenaria mercenaria]|uniref:uncharacterized protein LOC123559656 isoform X2 n=1 Tax=Mercenaria mercenaria TaxID=6596 RepID=UPI00234E7EA6|nr:uncharacterized protein LOC123559656 isoform X2 [Mercenaria mercenaria]
MASSSQDGWEERYDTIRGRVFYVHREQRIAQDKDPSISALESSQCDEDSINLTDNKHSLDDYPWFFGKLPREDANELLRHQPDGTFLMRESETRPGNFVISVRYGQHKDGVIHSLISSKHGTFFLQLGSNKDTTFETLSDLLEYCTRYQVFIYGMLTAPLNKFELEKAKDGEYRIPEELINDPYAQELYEKAIKEGTEKDNTIRVMVIGCCGQGKTSLVRRLLKQSIEGVETTNGINIHRCAIINDTEWVNQESEDPEKDTIQRLANIAKYDPDLSHHGSFGNEEEVSIKFCDHKDTETDNYTIDYDIASLYKMRPSATDKSDDDFSKNGRSSNKHAMSTVNNTSVSRPKIDVQNLKNFQTELKRLESGKDERKDGRATLNIWDFGGQFVYYATHQIFHSSQAVYILVFNLDVGLDTIIEDSEFPLHKKTMRDYLKFWVSSVNSFVGSLDGYEPPVILVGTHTDQLQEGVEIFDVFEEVRKMFEGRSCLNHIQPDHFAISNKDSSEEDIDQLREAITQIGQKQFQKRVPAKWILLEKSLKMTKRKKIVSFDDVIEIDSSTDSPLQSNDRKESVDQIKLFFSYHHARGTFCYFDDNRLSGHVVLDPQFLIDAFRCIITSENFCRVRPRLRGLWNELCDKAVLRKELLEEVWTRNDDNDFVQFKELLTEYMQKHRIISEVVACDPNFKSATERLGYYIVPSFLKVSDDGATIESFCSGKKVSEVSLGYVIENEAMVPVLFQTTVAALIGRWPLIRFNGNDILYDNVVACELVKDHAGVLLLTENSIELLVVNLCPPDSAKAETCDMFRRYVEVVIDTDMCKLRGTIGDRRFVKHMTVRCFHEDHGSKGSKGIYVVEEMQSYLKEKLPCPDKKNHCLRFENILQEWFLHDVVESEKVPHRKMTNKEYSTLSMAIGRGWQQLGHQLGLDTVEIDHIEMNKQTVDMRIYAMLQLWDKKEADAAQLDVLVRAIHKCSRQHINVNWDVLNNIINGF